MLYESFYSPESVEEALTILAESNGHTVKPIAGGTDLMIQLKERMVGVDALVDVGNIPEMRRIWADDRHLHLGGAVTYTQLIESDLINRHAYLLAEASKVIGAPQIQHMGTIGGNLGNASPAGDTLPCFVALDAQVTLASAAGERQVPMSDFMLGVRKTVLQPNELITRISFPMLPANAGSAFAKLGLRHSQAISVVDAAAVVYVEGGKISDVRIALGSVAPIIIRSPSAEQKLLGQAPSEKLIEAAGEAARQDISPITDIRGSRAYRLHAAKVMVKQALENALQRESFQSVQGR